MHRIATFVLAGIALGLAGATRIAESLAPVRVQETTHTPRLQPQLGHTGIVVQAVYSTDGQRILSLSDNGTAILWERGTGIQLRQLSLPKNSITRIAFANQGRWIVAGTELGFVQVWDSETGNIVRATKPMPGSLPPEAPRPYGKITLGGDVEGGNSIEILGPKVFGGVTAMAVHGPSNLAVVGNHADNNLYRYNVATGSEQPVIATGLDRICAISISPDGKSVAASDSAGRTILLDALSGEVSHRLAGHRASVTKSNFSSDGRYLLTLGLEQSARVWDVQTGKELAVVKDESIPGLAADFLPGGDQIAIESSPDSLLKRQFQVKVIDWRNNRVVRTIPYSNDWYKMPWDGTVSPDGKSLVTACLDNTVREISLADGKVEADYESRADVVQDLAIAKDGSAFLFAASRGTVSLFRAGTNHLQRVEVPIQPARLFRSTVAIHGDLALVDLADIRHYLVDLKSGKVLRPVETAMTASYEREAVYGAADQVWFAPDGTILTRYGLTTFACDPQTGKQIGSFDGNFDGFESLKELTEGEGDASDYLMAKSSPDGMTMAFYGLGPKVFLKDDFGAGKPREFVGHTQVVNDLGFSDDGKRIVTGGRDQTVKIWNTTGGSAVTTIKIDGNVLNTKFVGGDRYILTTTIDGRGYLHRSENGQEVSSVRGKLTAASEASVTPDGKKLLWVSENNSDFFRTGEASAHILDLTTGNELGQIVLFRNGDWAVLDDQGRYDANDPSGLRGLFWMVGNEPIGLGQFKSMYYDPGLLGKLLGTNPEPVRDVIPLTKVALYPEVEATLATDFKSARIRLTNRGGGLGTTEVRLNGALIATLNPPDPMAKEHQFVVDLAEPAVQARLLPQSALSAGQQNRLDVVAFNREAYLASRSRSIAVPAPETEATPPKLFVIAAGVSDYQGTELDLRYAAADAKSIAAALAISGERWLGKERLDVQVLVSESGGTGSAASKTNLKAAFDRVAKSAASTDIIVVYLAGHGINQAGTVDDYFYLAADAENSDLAIPEVRERVAVSGAELGEWLAAIPSGKQVLILDTCASGKVAGDLSSQRDVPSDVVRSWERLKDRSGVFILAGCASDAVSYEASSYGQGLLTYALLEAMAKDDGALRRDPTSPDSRAFVDVMGIYQRAADRVPDLVRQLGIGGIQRPEIKTRGSATSFDIGVLTPEDRSRIPLAKPRPVILRPSFEEQDQPEDPLDITRAVDRELRSASSRGQAAAIAFWDVAEHIGCFRVRGRYAEKDGNVTVTVYLSRMELTDGRLRPKALSDFQVVGDAKDPATLARKIREELEKRITAPAP